MRPSSPGFPTRSGCSRERDPDRGEVSAGLTRWLPRRRRRRRWPASSGRWPAGPARWSPGWWPARRAGPRHRGDRQIGETVAAQRLLRRREAGRRGDAQLGQALPHRLPGGKIVAAVHKYGNAAARQRQGRQHEPRRPARAAGAVRRPVQVRDRRARRQPGRAAGCLDQAGNLLGVLAAVAQQHQERADLHRIGASGQHHAERLRRLVARQRPRPARSAAERGDERGEPLDVGLRHAASRNASAAVAARSMTWPTSSSVGPS